MIWPDESDPTHPIPVLCHFDDDGKWIVLQRRVNGAVDFHKNWVEYRNGFGYMSYTSDFWLVIELIY